MSFIYIYIYIYIIEGYYSWDLQIGLNLRAWVGRWFCGHAQGLNSQLELIQSKLILVRAQKVVA
jgi:hypothetical protein